MLLYLFLAAIKSSLSCLDSVLYGFAWFPFLVQIHLRIIIAFGIQVWLVLFHLEQFSQGEIP
jgi:hypothetical protein